MSAYGAIASAKPDVELPVLSYPLPQNLQLTTYAVHGSDADPELITYLAGVFNEELAGKLQRKKKAHTQQRARHIPRRDP